MAWILQGKQGREGSWCAGESWGGEALRHARPKKLCARQNAGDHACNQQVLHWPQVKFVDWLLMVLLLHAIGVCTLLCCAIHKLEDISLIKVPYECLVMTCYMYDEWVWCSCSSIMWICCNSMINCRPVLIWKVLMLCLSKCTPAVCELWSLTCRFCVTAFCLGICMSCISLIWCYPSPGARICQKLLISCVFVRTTKEND